MEDEQVEDEPPSPKLRSPTPSPLEDLAHDIQLHHSTRVRSILHIYLTVIVILPLLHYTSLTPIMKPPLTLYGKLQ